MHFKLWLEDMKIIMIMHSENFNRIYQAHTLYTGETFCGSFFLFAKLKQKIFELKVFFLRKYLFSQQFTCI
jgi:hypothetical protein